MYRRLALCMAALAAACSPPLTGPFATQDDPARPAGAAVATAAIKFRVIARQSAKQLVVAAVDETETIASAPVRNGACTLELPAKPELDGDDSIRYIERWRIVLFNDKNGNGKYDYNLPTSRDAERDIELPSLQRYRVGYKSYAHSSHLFLPHNNFQQGWVLVSRQPGRNNSYSQDFTKTHLITDGLAGTDQTNNN